MTKAELIKKTEPAAADTAWPDSLLELQTRFAALLTKLDGDSGVGGTDYASTLGLTATKLLDSQA